MELKRLIGSDPQELHTTIDKVKLFKARVKSDMSMHPFSKDLWEDYHDAYMKEWEEFDQQYNDFSTIVHNFDRN